MASFLRLALAAALALPAARVAAETQTEIIHESRLVLMFAAPEVEAEALLPEGWRVAPAPAGAGRGATVLVVLIDRTLAAGPDGAPLEPSANRLVVLVVPGAGPEGETGPVVVGGWSDAPAGAPGAYGVFEDGEVGLSVRAAATAGEAARVEQDWRVAGPRGDRLSIRAGFPAGSPTLQSFDQKVWSAAKPGFHRLYRGDQGAVVVYSAPLGAGDSAGVAVETAGPLLGALLDDQAALVAVLHLPWYRRETFLP